jgi:predicted secreted protein
MILHPHSHALDGICISRKANLVYIVMVETRGKWRTKLLEEASRTESVNSYYFKKDYARRELQGSRHRDEVHSVVCPVIVDSFPLDSTGDRSDAIDQVSNIIFFYLLHITAS